MATQEDLRALALGIPGTTEAPHFDRTAFKVKRIYVTLAADGLSANFMLTPDEQQFKCMMQPEAFRPLPNKWGEKGATEGILAELSHADLQSVLKMAWQHALP